MAAGETVAGFPVHRIVFHQHDRRPRLVEFIELHSPSQQVGDSDFLAFMRSVEQSHLEDLRLGFDDQIGF